MSDLALDAGLVRRLRDAGGGIVWRNVGRRLRGGPVCRVARWREEEARVETRDGPQRATVEVTAGPVGAVVLLLEADRRGPPTALGSRNAGRAPSFPDGSIVALWGEGELPADATPTVRDLVELARYALP
jgi:hypothetical protein